MSSIVAPATTRRPMLSLLVRRRVPFSIALFGGLLAADLLSGQRPHDLLNIRDGQAMCGVVLVILGVAIRSWAAGTLHKWQQLTTTGPYRLVRNPLYAGSFLMMFGFCMLIGDWHNALLVVGPVALIYYLQVSNEEHHLGKRYTTAWQDYAAATPRFFPRRLPKFIAGEWRLSQWIKNKEFQAFGASAAGLLALQLWHNGLIHF